VNIGKIVHRRGRLRPKLAERYAAFIESWLTIISSAPVAPRAHLCCPSPPRAAGSSLEKAGAAHEMKRKGYRKREVRSNEISLRQKTEIHVDEQFAGKKT